MRLRTIARISVALSVILFCVAVGLYGLDRLAVANQERERSLYELVPDDCLGVMESDNAHFYMDMPPQMSYFSKLDQLTPSNSSISSSADWTNTPPPGLTGSAVR